MKKITIIYHKIAAFASRNGTLLSFLAAAIIVNMFIAWYVLTQKTVFYWDESGYWTLAIELTRAFRENMSVGVDLILKSLHTDYNLLPTLPIIPFMMFFGESRLVFILAITNLYLLPSVLMFAHLFDRFFLQKTKNKQLVSSIVILATALFPAALFPVLSGQIDAVGLPAIASIMFIMTRMTGEVVRPLYAILLGVNLCLLVVLRRWYSFWVVSAALAYAIVYATRLIVVARKKKRPLLSIFISARQQIINIGIASFVAIFLLYLLFPYLFHAYFVNYADLYSAYRSGRVSQLVSFVNHVGLVVLIMSLLGYLLAAIKERRQTNTNNLYIILFFALQAVLIYMLFTSTQDFSIHHYYLLVPALLLGIMLLICHLAMSPKSLAKWALLAVLITIISLPVHCFGRPISYRPTGKDLQATASLFFGRENGPIVRGDLDEMRSLASFLENNLGPSEYSYIISSSDVFNDSLFRNINLPQGFVDNVLTTAHVDKRDGFNNDLFLAKYVIVASPIQTHLGGGQLIIEYTAREILSGRATNLKEVARYKLDRGVELILYEKIDAYPQSFIDELKGRLVAAYGNSYHKITDIKQ